MKAFNRDELEYAAYCIRRHIVNTIVSYGEGHGGGALSAADIIAVLYNSVMNINLEDPDSGDKFLLSAGHKCLALYGALVVSKIVDEDVLKTYNQLGSPVPGHPDATKLRGIDFSTGSLGHGLSLGCGYALAAKLKKCNYKTYVLMGDGEQGEGSNWEAAAFAAHNKLDNLIAIIDENTLQINGRTYEVLKPSSYEERYKAFSWSVRSVDGHDVEALYNAFAEVPFEPGKPSMIVAKTVKGKGISFLEDDIKYHHWHPDAEQGAAAIEEITQAGKRWEA
jgi:transketolase